MIRDEDLREMIENLASSIDERDGNPVSWLSWIVYLLSQLDSHAMGADTRYTTLYRDMLSMLQESIRTRLRTGGW